MAELKIKPEYGQFANEISGAFKERGTFLSPHSVQLVHFSVEAWLDDGPRLKPNLGAFQDPRLLARLIVAKTLEEDHIRVARGRHLQIQFPTLMWALALKGREVVGDLLDKGF